MTEHEAELFVPSLAGLARRVGPASEPMGRWGGTIELALIARGQARPQISGSGPAVPAAASAPGPRPSAAAPVRQVTDDQNEPGRSRADTGHEHPSSAAQPAGEAPARAGTGSGRRSTHRRGAQRS